MEKKKTKNKKQQQQEQKKRKGDREHLSKMTALIHVVTTLR